MLSYVVLLNLEVPIRYLYCKRETSHFATTQFAMNKKNNKKHGFKRVGLF
jgi:hypothetical protein